jgi:hypothetical protein
VEALWTTNPLGRKSVCGTTKKTRQIKLAGRGLTASTVTNDPGSGRYHPNLYRKLSKILRDPCVPAPLKRGSMCAKMTRERAEFGAAWNSGNADLVASFFANDGAYHASVGPDHLGESTSIERVSVAG